MTDFALYGWRAPLGLLRRLALALLLCAWCGRLAARDEQQQQKLRVAFHAQAPPRRDQIVGSVVTTDGLASAFREAFPGSVQIFYPGSYHGFYTQEWDVLIIEGWFPSIHDILQAARLQHPQMLILFYCLDPAYPGYESVLSFQVDAVLTNSVELADFFRARGLPSMFMLLAADAGEMNPSAALRPSSSPAHEVVYVGAGGVMLQGKPMLGSLLHAAAASSPSGFAIYGKGWENTAHLPFWRGVLPREDLAYTYASARVVLAATLQPQRDFNMVNNRIFDALSCGGIVLTQHEPALEELFGDVLSYFHNQSHVLAQLQHLLALDESSRQSFRTRARQVIERHHTWAHRRVELLDWIHLLRRPPPPRPRRGAPRMLWLVSHTLEKQMDVSAVIEGTLRRGFAQHCELVDLSAEEAISRIVTCEALDLQCTAWLTAYDAIFVLAQPHDDLDRAIGLLPPLRTASRQLLQRRVVFYLGMPADLPQAVLAWDTRRYDLVLSRSPYEMRRWRDFFGLDILPLRLQHAFAVPSASTSASVAKWVAGSEEEKGLPVVVCFLAYKQLCNEALRSAEVLQVGVAAADHRLALVGGRLSQWTEVLGAQPLLHTVLVSQGGLEALAALMEKDTPVVFMNPPDHPLGLDEIGPFVTAMVAEARVRIMQPNSHLQSLATEGCSHWMDSAIPEIVATALQRLFGLPSVYSTVTATSVALPIPKSPSTVAENQEREGEGAFWKAVLDKHEVKDDEAIALFALSYTHFLPGRDGSYCFSNPVNASQSQCLSRAMEYVLLSFPESSLSRRRVVSFSLRGSSVSNEVQSTLLEVDTVSAAGIRQGGEELLLALERQQAILSSCALVSLPMQV